MTSRIDSGSRPSVVAVDCPEPEGSPLGVAPRRWPSVLYITLLSALLMYPFAPLRPSRFVRSDSGVFLYIGQQVVRGLEPYRNAWDHKPPLIFYIDALGLILGRGSVWGVWLIAYAACGAALWLCNGAARKVFGVGPAALGTVSMAALLMVTMEYANVAEFYALPLQLAIVALFLEPSGGRKYFSIGVATGLLSLLRPNLIGMGAAAALAAAIRPTGLRPSLFKAYSYMFAGVVAPLLIFAAYFASKGHLHDAFEASVLFNIGYAATSWRTRLGSLVPGVNAVLDAGIALLAAGGALFAFISRFQKQSRKVSPLVALCILDLPIEVFLSSLSGRGYLHYFVPWAPALGLLCAYSGYVITRFSDASELSLWKSYRIGMGAAILAIGIFLVHGFLFRSAARKVLSIADDPARESLARYINEHTSVGDGIYVWGYGPEIYVMSQRPSPSRYFMHTPLALRNFTDRSMILDIQRDLAANRPRLIIDSSYAIDGRYPHLDLWRSEGGGMYTPAMQPLFEFVESSYEKTPVPAVGKWVVYRLKESASGGRN
jgi:hypothetical protein